MDIENMQRQINEMQALLDKYKNELDRQPEDLINLTPSKDESARYKTGINLKTNYLIITLTFSPKTLMKLRYLEYPQIQQLTTFIKLFDSSIYFACIEQHMVTKLEPLERYHAHIMTNMKYEAAYKICKSNIKILIGHNACDLHPAINIKAVGQTIQDIERTYNYIWLDKKDHPIYKKMLINVSRKSL
jgi:hypothetical protein